MAKQKIDRVELHRMLKAGKTQKECAAHFKCSEVAVWKAKKELNSAVVKNVTMEAGHRVVESHLDTIGQLQKINEKTNLILDGLMKEITAKGRAARDAKKDLREIALKASQEIRGQLSLQLDIMKTLHDVTAIAEFQKEVLAVIGEANKCPECQKEIFCGNCFVKALSVSLNSFDEEGREKVIALVRSVPKVVIDLRRLIIDRLKQSRALRSGVTFKP